VTAFRHRHFVTAIIVTPACIPLAPSNSFHINEP